MKKAKQDERASGSSPEAGHKLDQDTPIETTEQLRIAIDQGWGGKVDATDPAAAPLGTDDEAGGASNSAAQVRQAAAHEIRVRPGKRQRATGIGPAWWLIVITACIGLAIVGFVFLLNREEEEIWVITSIDAAVPTIPKLILALGVLAFLGLLFAFFIPARSPLENPGVIRERKRAEMKDGWKQTD